jgi:hypothetical protein
MNSVTALRPSASPPLIQAARPRAETRFLEFFAANILGPNTLCFWPQPQTRSS